MDHLEGPANDVLEAASALLQRQAADPDQGAGVELDPQPRAVILRMVDGAARIVWRVIADETHVLLVASAGELAIGLLNALPEMEQIVIRRGMEETGSRLRVYAWPSTGQVAVSFWHKGENVPVGVKTVAHDPTVH